jgi:hypothetical protein
MSTYQTPGVPNASRNSTAFTAANCRTRFHHLLAGETPRESTAQEWILSI